MKRVSFLLVALLQGAAQEPARPNILILVADDLGYADVGFNGCTDIPTPNLDRLAKAGLRCTQGYVSHPFCSPTRAGLLAGRCQQRFGHENNPAWLPNDPVAGLPLSQFTIAQALKSAGYATGLVGKWHLGAHPSLHPNRRGFDDYYGILGGGHVYTPGAKGGGEYTIPIDRNGKPEPHDGYLTDLFTREAVAFIRRQEKKPWFLMLTYNAPHTPLQPHPRHLELLKGIPEEPRRNYGALVAGVDESVGGVMAALSEKGFAQNTLVFFISDNGGPTGVTRCSNGPLKGAKGQVYEGGIRVPFLVSWPERLPKGGDYAPPVSSLDFYATAAALAGAAVPAEQRLEGVNLIPHLSGEKPGAPHECLFWRTGGGASGALREGRWKLVRSRTAAPELYDLEADPGEARNLAAAEPERVKAMEEAYAVWDRDNVAPLFESPKAGKSKK